MAEFREIIKKIKKRDFSPVYILHGEEPYYLDKVTEMLEESVVSDEDKEFDQTVLYGADTSAAAVMEASSLFPLMSERRLVILKEAQAMHNTKGQLDKLAKYVETPNAATILVIIFKGEELKKSSQIIKAASKNKEITVFNSPPIKEHKVRSVIKDYCVAEKISIEDKAIEVLVGNLGTSLTTLFSELEKLKVASNGKNERITADLVNDHTGVSREFNNYELKTALARRDYFQAINIVKNFESNPKGNPIQKITAAIFSFYQNLLLAAFSADKSEKALMEITGFRNAYALTDIYAGLRVYNASQLVRAIRAIREFDAKSKGVGSNQGAFPLLLELVCTLLTL